MDSLIMGHLIPPIDWLRPRVRLYAQVGRFLSQNASTSLLPGDPICDLFHHFSFYTVEAVVSHRFTGITLALSSLKREQLFARNGGQFVH